MNISQGNLQRKVIDTLASQGLRTVVEPTLGSQPLKVVLDDDGTEIRARIYIRNVTHGGRGRKEKEYRIQLTGEPPKVHDGSLTLLLGYFEPKDVYVSFDPSVHLKFGASPSIQVTAAALDRAALEGVYRFRRRRRRGVEDVIAASSGHLGDVVRHAAGRTPYGDGDGEAAERSVRDTLAPPLATATQLDFVNEGLAGNVGLPRRDSTEGRGERINIRPGVAILALFPHMNYKPWFALAEFVDNALASYNANRHRLIELNGPSYQFRVVVEVDGADEGAVRVWDNAGGIGQGDYDRAFVTAAPPPDTTGLSEFGIGMKSASCWFAKRWRVSSQALDEAVERVVDFDVPQIVRDHIEELKPEVTKTTSVGSFTEVKLWDLYKPPQTKTVSKMREHLASIYREFIDSGEMRLEFNGEPLRYQHPRVLVAPRWDDDDGPKVEWRKDLSFTLPTGEHVTGFGALRETGSTRYAGFALFRHRRLVVGSSDEAYRPIEVFGGTNSYRYQRLFGELHLDQFDISHTKDGFIWGDREQSFLATLRKELDLEPLPILLQAERYRSRKADAAIERAADLALAGTAAAVGEASDVVERQTEEAPSAEPPPEAHPAKPAVAQRTLDLAIRGVSWHIVIDVTNDPAQTDWVAIADTSSSDVLTRGQRQLGIRVSLASPFMRRFSGATAEDLEPLLRVAAGVALAEITARESGVKLAGTVRRNLNELLATALSRE
jgi:hypothetical protein